MSSKFFIYTALLFVCILTLYGCNRDDYYRRYFPNVTDLTPTISSNREVVLFDGIISVSLKVYERPVNNTHKIIIHIIDGSTNINSINRCISYGVGFNLWGQNLTINYQTNENGGCDALWGNKCSQNLRLSLFADTYENDYHCGVNTEFYGQPPEGCPQDNMRGYLVSSMFLQNGIYMIHGPSSVMPLTPWVYDESAPMINVEADQLMKTLVFVYFFGVETSSFVTRRTNAIACLYA